jgi:hypothetical protein
MNATTSASTKSALLLGFLLFAGLSSLGWLLGKAALDFKAMERTVTVKGLAEREYPADIVIWPLQFSEASNQLDEIYTRLEQNTGNIRGFLSENGISPDDISVSPPAITDKSAQTYGNNAGAEFRFTATQTVTIYSKNIEQVRNLMNRLGELGKKGIVFNGGDYQSRTQYLFTGLNELKPAMIEEATMNARAVASKFAEDSNSRLGKIKNASQGQFSINDRDSNNPHIKSVRVVSTVEYYLSD